MSALIEYFAGYVRATVGRHANVAAILAAAFGLLFFAFGFALLAAQAWLEASLHSAVEADLVVAAALLVAALGVALFAEAVRRRPPPVMPTPVGLALAIPIAAKLAPKLLSPKWLGIAAVVVGGLIAGREIGRKKDED